MTSENKPNEGKSKGRVFAERLFSTLLLAGLVGGTFLSGQAWAFMGLMVLLAMAAAGEFFAMTKRGGVPCQRRWGSVLSLGYLLLLGVMLTRYGVGFDMAIVDGLAVVVLVIGAFCLRMREEVNGQEALMAIAVTVLGFVYVPYMFSYLARLCFLPEGASEVPGASLVLWVVVVTKCTDMGAYVTGSLFGKHKMIPHISPGKTWQGFVGAIIVAFGVSCLFYALSGESLAVMGGWGHVMILGILVPLLTVFGDLAESVLKRSMDVKDSGNTLPGIGGILDLLDSLCFTAPFVYWYLLIMMKFG